MAGELQIIIDLAPDATPIEGQVFTQAHPARPFHGWLELASAIEQLRGADRPLTPHAARQPRPGDIALRTDQ
jgi:hypothetical protein